MNLLLDSIFENVESAVILVDQRNHIIRLNHRFEAMTGFPIDEVINRPFREWLEPNEWNMLPFEGHEALRNINRTYSLRRAEGESLTVHTEVIPLNNEVNPSKAEEEAIKSLYFIFDFTEIENLFRENLHLARLASLGKLMSGIIHEISNPLSIIAGCAQLLSTNNPPPEIAVDLDRICSEARRTSALFKTVLSFGRKQNEAKEILSIHEVVEEVTTLKRYALKNKDITLQSTTAHPSNLHVYGYRTQLMQVILNLINNAEQAVSESGGKGSIGIHSSREGQDAVITVFDSGQGIRSEDKSLIFDAFYTTKELTRGTGLGLYISKSIVQKHEGKLRLVESEQGNTVFEIKLPLSEQVGLPLPESQSTELEML